MAKAGTEYMIIYIDIGGLQARQGDEVIGVHFTQRPSPPVPKDAERHWDVNLILFTSQPEQRPPNLQMLNTKQTIRHQLRNRGLKLKLKFNLN